MKKAGTDRWAKGGAGKNTAKASETKLAIQPYMLKLKICSTSFKLCVICNSERNLVTADHNLTDEGERGKEDV